ncbi:hypothetical protein [Micromonospora fulviviridis]|uniref:hypothetical protein n=1 Tax=Micromonospora fulviviridis TaxID=47860 RepID=UPI003798C0F2
MTTANRHDGVQTADLASMEYFVEAVTQLHRHWHSGGDGGQRNSMLVIPEFPLWERPG